MKEIQDSTDSSPAGCSTSASSVDMDEAEYRLELQEDEDVVVEGERERPFSSVLRKDVSAAATSSLQTFQKYQKIKKGAATGKCLPILVLICFPCATATLIISAKQKKPYFVPPVFNTIIIPPSSFSLLLVYTNRLL